MPQSKRIKSKFEELKNSNKKGLITFVTAGDPNYDTSLEILKKLPDAGADIIEIGMPFTDPMADGPGIQASYLRALEAGQTLKKTIQLVKDFREFNSNVPIVLMGYYNPIYKYGVETFIKNIKEIGVDGIIVVDLPPEADRELCIPANEKGIDFIRLATPTSNEDRLPKIVNNASGFLYYVSVAGITGSKAPEISSIESKIKTIRNFTDIPIAVGFGIKTPEQAVNIAKTADAVVVGSAIIDKINEAYKKDKNNIKLIADSAADLVKNLSNALNNYKE
ncbi:MAG: tryptophan synthase subunit alpha [Alphaproteobacteria bacterium]|jgi:tryptophan synthase alpha chain|tara:strand:+ start:75 stop:908 length:834 start_codon:yes stop_codon:yes gene_type:complete